MDKMRADSDKLLPRKDAEGLAGLLVRNFYSSENLARNFEALRRPA